MGLNISKKLDCRVFSALERIAGGISILGRHVTSSMQKLQPTPEQPQHRLQPRTLLGLDSPEPPLTPHHLQPDHHQLSLLWLISRGNHSNFLQHSDITKKRIEQHPCCRCFHLLLHFKFSRDTTPGNPY